MVVACKLSWFFRLPINACTCFLFVFKTINKSAMQEQTQEWHIMPWFLNKCDFEQKEEACLPREAGKPIVLANLTDSEFITKILDRSKPDFAACFRIKPIGWRRDVKHSGKWTLTAIATTFDNASLYSLANYEHPMNVHCNITKEDYFVWKEINDVVSQPFRKHYKKLENYFFKGESAPSMPPVVAAMRDVENSWRENMAWSLAGALKFWQREMQERDLGDLLLHMQVPVVPVGDYTQNHHKPNEDARRGDQFYHHQFPHPLVCKKILLMPTKYEVHQEVDSALHRSPVPAGGDFRGAGSGNYCTEALRAGNFIASCIEHIHRAFLGSLRLYVAMHYYRLHSEFQTHVKEECEEMQRQLQRAAKGHQQSPWIPGGGTTFRRQENCLKPSMDP